MSSLTHATDICEALELPYRIVEMVTGDLGFAAAKKYDVEVWAAGCDEWLEVSSASNTESFQARRANVKYRPADGGKTQPCTHAQRQRAGAAADYDRHHGELSAGGWHDWRAGGAYGRTWVGWK